MVFLLLGLQLPGILETSLMAAEIDPNVEIWMLFTDIILIYAALMLVRFGWLWTMKKFSNRFLKKKPMEFGSWTTREIPDRVFRRGAWGDHSGWCALYPAALAGW
ncbi:putative sodium/hydrogen exchanger [Escherichia coli]|uniref:Putative sodium/hydrogen exchanger n=1 Tax=Escherichia coli TaxID=562 RepID=A0A376LFL4_ECOLX|nr:putative sodium/hydrogen exchanger [Escherichia coli]